MYVCKCAKQYPHRRSHPIGAYFPEEGDLSYGYVCIYVCIVCMITITIECLLYQVGVHLISAP